MGKKFDGKGLTGPSYNANFFIDSRAKDKRNLPNKYRQRKSKRLFYNKLYSQYALIKNDLEKVCSHTKKKASKERLRSIFIRSIQQLPQGQRYNWQCKLLELLTQLDLEQFWNDSFLTKHLNLVLQSIEKDLVKKSFSIGLEALITLSMSCMQLKHVLSNEHNGLFMTALYTRLSNAIQSIKVYPDEINLFHLFNVVSRMPFNHSKGLVLLYHIASRYLKLSGDEFGHLTQKVEKKALWKMQALVAIVEKKQKTSTNFRRLNNMISKKQSGIYITTDLQKTVLNALKTILPKKLKNTLEEEYKLGLYSLDIALIKLRIAIEIDGSHHYRSGHLILADHLRDLITWHIFEWKTIRFTNHEIRSACRKHQLKELLKSRLAPHIPSLGKQAKASYALINQRTKRKKNTASPNLEGLDKGSPSNNIHLKQTIQLSHSLKRGSKPTLTEQKGVYVHHAARKGQLTFWVPESLMCEKITHTPKNNKNVDLISRSEVEAMNFYRKTHKTAEDKKSAYKIYLFNRSIDGKEVNVFSWKNPIKELDNLPKMPRPRLKESISAKKSTLSPQSKKAKRRKVRKNNLPQSKEQNASQHTPRTALQFRQ